MTLHTEFLNWNRPLLDEAVDFLLGDYQGGLLDLRDTIIILPTANSGRRLRERLAHTAAAKGGAVLPGLVTPPHGLLSSYPGPEVVAGRMETLAAWMATLGQVRQKEYPALFPTGSKGLADGERLRRLSSLAEKLRRLRSDLGEQGLSLQALSGHPDWHGEPARWRELARLEKLYLKQLARRNRIDLPLAQLRIAEKPTVPEDVRRVVLLAVPDPLPLVLKVLEQWSQQIEVEIVIQAPDELQEEFDSWGRPLPDRWTEIPIDLASTEIRLADKPAAQARQLLQLPEELVAQVAIGDSPAQIPLSDLAIGVLNPEVVPFIEQQLQERGGSAWNPAGVPCSHHPLTRLVTGFCELLQDDSFAAFSRLVRRHALLQRVAREPEFNSERMLTQLDAVQNYYLPATFSRLREAATAYHRSDGNSGSAPDLIQLLELLAPLLEEAHRSLTSGLRGFLQLLLQDQQLNSDHPADRERLLVLEQLAQLLNSFDQLTTGDYQLAHADQLQLLMQEVKALRYHPERPSGSVELEGWLELQWNDAPCLLLSGMNDGFVPESISGDLFLPDSARAKLQLRSNAARFARDAYLLSALAASRRDGKSCLQIIVGKNSSRGDPLKPSRLLFQCGPELLADRVRQLFGSVPPGRTTLVSSSWQLQPTGGKFEGGMTVTDFQRYLNCPFRFYLSRVLRMEIRDDRERELSPARFGQLCHKVLEQFGHSELRDAEDEQVIAAELLQKADALLHAIFGRELTTALIIQRETMRRRLRRAAAVQAQLRREGWQILDVERTFRQEESYLINDMLITGTIDRVDQHKDGSYRLLDYKTGGSELEPEKTHLGKPDDLTRHYNLCEAGDKPRAWKDLQLPLYHAMLSEQLSGELQVGYFALPSSGSDAGVYSWELSDSMVKSALDCAAGIIDDIRAGRFWPPSARVRYDEFARFYNGNPEDQVSEAARARLQGEGR